MGSVEFEVRTAAGMRATGERLATVLEPGDLVLLTGDLGAGKTTLTQGIGVGLGVRGAVTSPTFVIAREHPSSAGGPGLVHVDAYRLGSLVEVDDLDLDTSLADSVTVVEWGTGLVEDLAGSRLEIRLIRPRGEDQGRADPSGGSLDASLDGDEVRRVRLTAVGPRWEGTDLSRVGPGPSPTRPDPRPAGNPEGN
ncbi:MAG: tRNA threonylcarbamoyladenosine biosynthesis protein TsaE [Actinomycetota bacterium]|nr:tRNA threonylcarbamoyladenosine biosynthesis protein TsaE [Actinomycetota bacterium]